MILTLNFVEFVFLGIILVIYWCIKSTKGKIIILLIPSLYLLHSFGWIALMTVISLIVFCFFFGKKISKINNENKADNIYWIVFSCLIIIFAIGEYFNDKYLIFGMGFGLLIFQLISFISDIYLGRIKDNYNWYTFLSYFVYFPKYAVGPVENTSNLFEKLNNKIVWDKVLFEKGVFLIIVGLFKKIVIADNINDSTNSIINGLLLQNPIILWPKAFFNFIKIYSDFSGMIDVILGVSCLFGLELLINFNNPLKATGFRDYWNRWHISLSKWVLEYLFKPISFQLRNVTKKFTGVVVIIFAFVIISIWHGYSWSYFCFGMLHAFFIIMESAFNIKWISDRNKFLNILSYVGFFMLISVITLFFTEESVLIPITYILSLFNFNLLTSSIPFADFLYLIFGFFLFIVLIQVEKMYSYHKPILSLRNFFLLLIIYLIWPENPQSFIYQF